MAVDPASRAGSMRGRVIRGGDTPVSNGNIANIITILRILLAPVFVWMLLADGGDDGALRWTAAALFVLAIATDSVDGILARRRNLITDLGKLLDPIADKVLIGGALIALSLLGELWWWVTALILLRELGITVYRMIALRDRVIPASRGGKLKTIAQSIAISLFLFPFDRVLGDWVLWVDYAAMAVAVVLTITSGVDYLLKAWRSREPRR
ncbi:CDP-diacylglycerol--glycerol-3-phosphate 3-phosphatidyltransferase [Desertivibrio insolitus]|uniref:CDP-diacylglycerol--glycerol-3-phosphate 3-phosphatidyltransferase n=1 Tax=Herbiconiux sp. SYSU D00978 TaxID=2812562 RepID=UPI001A960398|nr:CDP-diacylglycerol--glycerol-3-phosphate 3-phosphatidyltransferase [Herbiconiux sp. SYSU D00978]